MGLIFAEIVNNIHDINIVTLHFIYDMRAKAVVFLRK